MEPRTTVPSYADADMAVAQMEPVTVTIPIGSMNPGTNAVVTAKQGLLKIQNLNLASYDTGHILITNLAPTTVPANLMVGHIAHQIVSNQGNPQVGVLQSGQAYTGLSLQLTTTVYALATVAAGNMVVTGTALLLGTGTS